MAHVTLSQLTKSIKHQLDQKFLGYQIWVVGEITNLKFYPAKKMYFFELVEKDADGFTLLAKCAASLFGNSYARVLHFEKSTSQPLAQAMKVLVQVQVDYHPVYGLKLIVRDIDPSYTLGEMERWRRETLRQLKEQAPEHVIEKDGVYSSTNALRPWPVVVQRIAVLTSEVSDGYADFLHELNHNRYGYAFEVLPFYSLVQGAAAGKQLAKSFDDALRCQPDLIALVRGGGSQNDLTAFDDLELALRIARSPVPVITGIGHLKNESIADMMAHTAAKTPTKAAEEIVGHNQAFEALLGHLQQSIARSAQLILATEKHASLELQALVHRTAQTAIVSHQKQGDELKAELEKRIQKNQQLRKHELEALRSVFSFAPKHVLASEHKQLSNLQQRMAFLLFSTFEQENIHLAHQRALIRLSDPEHILKKGYAVVYANDRIITGVHQLRNGDPVEVRMHDGLIHTSTYTPIPSKK